MKTAMTENTLDALLRQGLIADEDAERIRLYKAKEPFSLHWELKTMLYLGVLLLNIGLGVVVYEHIDSIGHVAIITGIGALSTGCFAYVIRHRRPFSTQAVESPTPYYDYIFLLGCLAFLIAEGYWQFQYKIFGEWYGLATFIPMVLFFGLAYRFDNRAVLALGITALASWLGVTVTPQKLLTDNDFDSETLAVTGIFLGAFLSTAAFLSERYDFKKHFALTYLNFGAHLGMVACLAGIITLQRWPLYFPLLSAAVGFFLWYARTRASFYFLVVAVVYGYIGFTYVLFDTLMNDVAFIAYLTYFIFSCVGILVFLVRHKHFFKTATP